MTHYLLFSGDHDALRMEQSARRFYRLKMTDCSLLHANKEEQLFIPKESAYERRNRGQKWYRRFEKRRN